MHVLIAALYSKINDFPVPALFVVVCTVCTVLGKPDYKRNVNSGPDDLWYAIVCFQYTWRRIIRVWHRVSCELHRM